MKRLFRILFSVAALSPALARAAATVDIASSVDKSQITVGDQIRYEIRVEYPAGGSVELPSVLGNLGAFEVKDYQAPDPKESKGRKTRVWTFRLSTFTVGKYAIPPQEVLFRPEADTNGSAYRTQPIEINVVRSSPETVKDIADIAGLMPIPRAQPWLLYVLLAALAIGLAWFFLLRKRIKAATPEKPPLPPFEEALEKLAALKSVPYVRQNRAKEFSFLLSELLRRYVSRRFAVDALESTTEEFLKLIPSLPVAAEEKSWLGRFCEVSDLVKFANADLLESQAEKWLAETERFLRQTRPNPETAAEPQGEGQEPKP